ncbi:MAG: peptidylprolyl isomerase [Rhodothermales bacterium]
MKRNPFFYLVCGVVPLCLILGCNNGTPGATAQAGSLPSDTPASTSEPSDPETLAAADPTAPAPGKEADSTQTNYYEIQTPLGRMVIKLYDETPGHRDNFRKLVAEQFYDSTLFHRVIQGFMIQGGDPNSRDDNLLNDGRGGPGYTLPAEFHPGFFHTRGAIAAARRGDPVNPRRESSGSQFYIVQGRPFEEAELDMIEIGLKQQIPNPDFAFPDSIRTLYTTVGGVPNLDGLYVIFGELVAGFDVLDSIAGTPTPRSTGQNTSPLVIDRPMRDIPMIIRPLPGYKE